MWLWPAGHWTGRPSRRMMEGGVIGARYVIGGGDPRSLLPVRVTGCESVRYCRDSDVTFGRGRKLEWGTLSPPMYPTLPYLARLVRGSAKPQPLPPSRTEMEGFPGGRGSTAQYHGHNKIAPRFLHWRVGLAPCGTRMTRTLFCIIGASFAGANGVLFPTPLKPWRRNGPRVWGRTRISEGPLSSRYCMMRQLLGSR